MKFDYISPRVKGDLPFICSEKLSHIAMELCTREDNRHIGSGMGGNPSQFIVLMDMRHILSGDNKNKIRLDSVNREVIWGYRWLQDKSKQTIRQELNEQFQKLDDSYKSRAVDLVSAFGSENIINYLYNAERFNRLVPLLMAEGTIEGLTPQESLMIACAVCQALAKELDRNDTTNISKVGKFLSQFSLECILLSIRMHIQIDRLVKFNLDEHPDWCNLLGRINRSVNSK